MKQSLILITLVGAGATGGDRPDGHLRSQKMVPALEPHFHKDYPDDSRPDIKMLKDKGFHDFSLPFPSVQSSSNYDRDYVKDENNDNGEWQAQADYDRLKGKMEKGHKALTAAKKRMSAEKVEVDKLLTKVDELKKKTGSAKLSAEQKRHQRESLEREEKEAWDKFVKAREAAGNMSYSKVPKDPVDKAKFMLKKEEIEFERCKKELEAAHAQLEAAQKKYDHNVGEQKRLTEAMKVKMKKEADELGAQAKKLGESGAAAQAAADEAANSENDLKKKASEAEAKVRMEKSKLDSVDEAVTMAKKKVKNSEIDLRKAECELRKYRGYRDDGLCEDKHDKKKSHANVVKFSAGFLLLFVFAMS